MVVQGVLWVTDEMEAHEVVPLTVIHDALGMFLEDDLVFLPAAEVQRRIRRIASLL